MTDRIESCVAWLLLALFAFALFAGVAHAATAPAGDGGVNGFEFAVMTGVHFVITMIYAVVAIAVLFFTLRFRDNLLQVKFRTNVLKIIHRSPVAAAVYYGVWTLAGALIVARAFA
jgi:uncharacterized membrane protein